MVDCGRCLYFSLCGPRYNRWKDGMQIPFDSLMAVPPIAMVLAPTCKGDFRFRLLPSSLDSHQSFCPNLGLFAPAGLDVKVL